MQPGILQMHSESLVNYCKKKALFAAVSFHNVDIVLNMLLVFPSAGLRQIHIYERKQKTQFLACTVIFLTPFLTLVFGVTNKVANLTCG